MPYFADELSRERLALLIFLKKVDCEVTRDQIAAITAGHEFMPYFELQDAVTGFEEGGFISARNLSYGQAFSVTSRGDESIAMFMDQLPASQIEEIEKFAGECHELLRREIQFPASYVKNETDCTATFKIMDNDEEYFVFSVRLPDADSAKAACANWSNVAQRVYKLMFAELFA